MVKVRILHIKKIMLNTVALTNVKPPDSSFVVDLNSGKSLHPLLEDTKTKKVLETAALRIYKAYLSQCSKRLQKFDRLFAGMLAKGVAPAEVAKQAEALKQALEKEIPKWEKAAALEAMRLLEKLAKKKR